MNRGERIPIAADHAGFEMKQRLVGVLRNILVLPSRFMSGDEAEQSLRTWLETPLEGGRHERRVEKIDQEGE